MKLGNLDARRDLTYASDTVAGFLRAGAAQGVAGQTYNLGTGEEIRIGDLAHEIISQVGRPAKIVIDPHRLRPEKSEVQRLLSDNRLAKEKIDWSPKVSLPDGLAKTITWVEQNLTRFRLSVYAV